MPKKSVASVATLPRKSGGVHPIGRLSFAASAAESRTRDYFDLVLIARSSRNGLKRGMKIQKGLYRGLTTAASPRRTSTSTPHRIRRTAARLRRRAKHRNLNRLLPARTFQI